jgi:DNA-binding beta-propeller fold protein YncE
MTFNSNDNNNDTDTVTDTGCEQAVEALSEEAAGAQTQSEAARPAVEGVGTERRGRRRKSILLALGTVLLLLFCCSCLVWGYYLSTRRSIIALPPSVAITRSIRPTYAFSIYGMVEPVGVAGTPSGDRIYVAESGGERLIRVFDPGGKPLASFAPADSRTAGRAPMYIALDQAGRVYVSDRIRGSIDTYDAGGNFTGSLAGPAGGWAPMGLRLQGDTLYITDVSEKAHSVLLAGKDGVIQSKFGREGKGGGDELWFPNSVIEDDRGRLYVSDSNNGRVKVFDGTGNLLDVIGGFGLPRGMARDAAQRVYVVDGVSHLVHVLDVSGETVQRLFTFGDFGVGDGEFNYPNDIAVDNAGRLYIADRVNNRVQVWVY